MDSTVRIIEYLGALIVAHGCKVILAVILLVMVWRRRM